MAKLKPVIVMGALLLTCAGVVIGMGTEGDKDGTASSDKPTKIIPWGEANLLPNAKRRLPSGESYYRRTLDGLRFWQTVVDEAIVTTHPSPDVSDPVMRGLVRELRPMQIIPGVQVNPALVNRLDNVNGWKQVASAVARLTEITGSDQFVIDCELGWKDMRLGKYVPDWDRVRAGLKLLPRDVSYTWYPSISCWVDRFTHKQYCADDLQLQTKFLKCVIETLPKVRLVTFEHSGPRSATYEPEIARQAYVKKHFNVPTLPIVYFEPASSYWKPEQILEARDTCQSPEMGAYFGVENWAECARIGPRLIRQDLEQRAATPRTQPAGPTGRPKRR